MLIVGANIISVEFAGKAILTEVIFMDKPSGTAKNINRLYVFYNFEASTEGSPFAMCDRCKKDYRGLDNCMMRELATHASMPCNLCGFPEGSR